MRIRIDESQVVLWLSANDTYNWAQGCAGFDHATRWPCSTLSGHRLMAVFDTNGIVGFTVNGKEADPDALELFAICADFIGLKLKKDHPCYDVVVGQLKS